MFVIDGVFLRFVFGFRCCAVKGGGGESASVSCFSLILAVLCIVAAWRLQVRANYVRYVARWAGTHMSRQINQHDESEALTPVFVASCQRGFVSFPFRLSARAGLSRP